MVSRGENLYDVALRVTDHELGWGVYASMAQGYAHPEVEGAIARWRQSHVLSPAVDLGGDDQWWTVECSCGETRKGKTAPEAVQYGWLHRQTVLGP